jgi:hypothetical protein
VRGKLFSSLFCGVLLALSVPATADVCNGCSGGTSGGSTTTLNRLSVSNGAPFPATSATPEGSQCEFIIRRLKPRNGITRVRWHTKNGSAVGNPETGQGDFQSQSGVAVFNAEHPSTVHIFIQTNFDSEFQEPTERFFLVIVRPTNGAVVDATGFCDIANNPGD